MNSVLMRTGGLSLLLCAVMGAHSQTGYVGMSVERGGALTGSVRLQSLSGVVQTERMTKDEAVCGRRKPCPRLFTGRNNGVRFAVVWIEGITHGKKPSPPGVATLRQRNCEYIPHVLIMGQADRLEIVNEDPLLHNVHSYDVNNRSRSVFNIAQPVRGYHTRVREADLADIHSLMATCDAGHPWMSAYVLRASNPYCAVTDADGNFRMEDIPPGTYMLKMWHEGIAARPSGGGPGTPPVVEEPYTAEQKIKVGPDQKITVDFVFSPRSL